MNKTLTITLVLAILAAGVVGLMYVFGFMEPGRAGEVLLKTVGGFVIIGACAAAIGALMSGKKDSQH